VNVDGVPVRFEYAYPVQFVSVPLVGVPRTGVTNVGDVANTRDPLPVSSLITPASCEDVVAANCESGLVVKASPPPLIVCHVESPRRNFVVMLVPEPSLAGSTVPLVISLPECV
jgi:hypothetical protein